MADAIAAEGLRKEYDGSIALDSLTLAVPERAVCALVGPNGAGKTTLLRLVAALLEPTAGDARVFGRSVRADARGVHASLGFLPDFFGLYEDLTAADCLRYFARAYRLRGDAVERRVAEVLELVNLTAHADDPIPTLSRGMRQRLGMARTLVHDPALLLLDEPASGLDPASRHDLQSLLKTLAAAGKTIVVSSHILSELEDYCSHVVMLDRGRLVFAGAVDAARRAARGARRFRLRAASGLDAAARLVAARGGSDWKAEGGEASFALAAAPEQTAALLKELVDAGIPVSWFGETAGGIQDSYLALMGKEGA